METIKGDKLKKIVRYEAFDGKLFNSPEEAFAHEKSIRKKSVTIQELADIIMEFDEWDTFNREHELKYIYNEVLILMNLFIQKKDELHKIYYIQDITNKGYKEALIDYIVPVIYSNNAFRIYKNILPLSGEKYLKLYEYCMKNKYNEANHYLAHEKFQKHLEIYKLLEEVK